MHLGTPVVPEEYMMYSGWSKGVGSNCSAWSVSPMKSGSDTALGMPSSASGAPL